MEILVTYSEVVVKPGNLQKSRKDDVKEKKKISLPS